MTDRIAYDAVTIAPAPSSACYSLRTRASEGLPPILASAPFAGGHALGLGPDEWLLILPDAARPPAMSGVHALVDIGHREVGLTIEGPAAAAMLQSGIALDLSLAAFPIGKVTRTLYDGVDVMLWRTGEASFRLHVWRSFAEHLWGLFALVAGDLQRCAASQPSATT